MSRTIAGSLVGPDGTALAGTLSLTAKTSTPGAAGVAETASFDIALVAGAYSDEIELGNYLVDWLETGQTESVRLGEASIDAGASSDLLTLIDASASPRSSTLGIAYGGTGATTEAAARISLGLEIGADVQAYDATLLSLAALGTAADKLAYTTGIDTWAESALTAYGRSLLDDANSAAARTTLELDLIYQAGGNVEISGNMGLGVTPESWAANRSAIQVNSTGSFAASTTQAFVSENAYFDVVHSRWERIAASHASQICVGNGTIELRVAASSTEDSEIVWTDALVATNDAVIGVGVIPETWAASRKAIQINDTGSVAASTTQAFLSENAYFDSINSRWERIEASHASQISVGNGTIELRVAATDAADSEITWTYAVAINNYGNVGVGVTPESWATARNAVQINDTGSVAASTTQAFLSENAYFDSVDLRWERIEASHASQVVAGNGIVELRVGGTDAADSEITWSTGLTLDNSSNIYGTTGTTGMTDGFVFIPAAAGAPSGAVSLTTATLAAMYYDTANKKFYVYNHVANAWEGVTLA